MDDENKVTVTVVHFNSRNNVDISHSFGYCFGGGGGVVGFFCFKLDFTFEKCKRVK